MYGWRMRDVSKIRVMPKIDSDTQWIHPMVLEQMMNRMDDRKLEAIRPKMKRF